MQAERRTMTISREEFLRSLQPLAERYQIVINESGTEVEIARPSFKAALQLRDKKPFVLGSLKMPSLDVVFYFGDSVSEEIEQFWLRFDLCFRRGGG